MKPCSKNRKRIAWLMVDALEARAAAALREHMLSCEGCRRHGEEILKVTKKLAAAQPESGLQAGALFHQRVAEKLRARAARPVAESWMGYFRGMILDWRVVAPTSAAVIILVAAILTLRPSARAVRTTPGVDQSASTSIAAENQMVGGQSLDKLDELLTKQGNTRLPPAPVYTAASVRVGDEVF